MSIPFARTSLASRRAAMSAVDITVLLVRRGWSGTVGQRVDRSGGGADDHRAHEGRRFRKFAVDDVVDDEPASFQGLERRAVAVASDHEPAQPVDPVLPARYGSIVGSDMLDE